MVNNCQVAKEIKCRSCNSPSSIPTAFLPTASIRPVEGEAGHGQSMLVLEYHPDKLQQQ